MSARHLPFSTYLSSRAKRRANVRRAVERPCVPRAIPTPRLESISSRSVEVSFLLVGIEMGRDASLKERNHHHCLNFLRLASLMLFVLLTSCTSGTWTDDPGNFKRIFDFSKPDDVKVLHSYYWKSPHWTVEYAYFIVLQPSQKFTSGLTDPRIVTVVKSDEALLDSCDGKRPAWFLPKPITNYDAWLSKAGGGYRLFRDKTDGTLFLCDERL